MIMFHFVWLLGSAEKGPPKSPESSKFPRFLGEILTLEGAFFWSLPTWKIKKSKYHMSKNIELESCCHESTFKKLDQYDQYPPKAIHRNKFRPLLWSKKSSQGLGVICSRVEKDASTCSKARKCGCLFFDLR